MANIVLVRDHRRLRSRIILVHLTAAETLRAIGANDAADGYLRIGDPHGPHVRPVVWQIRGIPAIALAVPIDRPFSIPTVGGEPCGRIVNRNLTTLVPRESAAHGGRS